MLLFQFLLIIFWIVLNHAVMLFDFSYVLVQEYFQLSVMAVNKMSSKSGSCYNKAVSVLKILADFRVCVLMLDLELDELILQLFRQFLDTSRYTVDNLYLY